MFKDCGMRPILATAILLACGSAVAVESPMMDATSVAAPSPALKPLPPPSSPTLAVPDDSHVVFYYDAVGVQIYTCQVTSTGHAWTFQGPEASLFDRQHHLVVKHYAGPTWESVSDRSKVVAKKRAEFSASDGAIPELLLEATKHDGKGSLSEVDYIQRLATTGGLAPTTGCDASHVGATARVDYTATYTFSRPKPHAK